MVKNNQSDKLAAGDPLAERLRGEALAEQPEFSENLHQRIIRSVGDRRAEEATLRVRDAAAGRRRRLATVFAAACAIFVAAVFWRFVPDLMQDNSIMSDSQLVKKYPYLNGKIEDLPPLNGLTDRAAEELDVLLVSSGFKLPTMRLTDDAQSMADSFLQRISYDIDQPEDRSP